MNLATTQSELEEFAGQRELVADEINRMAEAVNIAPERLALGLCAFPQGTTAGSVGRALWGLFMTDLDLVVGVALHRHCKARWEANIPAGSMMRN